MAQEIEEEPHWNEPDWVEQPEEQGEPMDFHQEDEVDAITMERFEALHDEYFDIRDLIDEQEKIVKSHRADLAVVTEKIIAHLEHFKKNNHSGRRGMLTIKTEKYPSLPKDEVKRNAFFGYLKSKGIFDSMISVNHNTLKSWHKEESEAHKDDPTFAVPGLEPFERKSLAMKRKK